MNTPSLTLLLAAPRGFCAGVERAIDIVERTLKKFGPPVYVRHEIVHNKYVLDDLRQKGAVFVKELSEVPDGAPVVFSAHGVARSVMEEARQRNLFYVDAVCPLVSKVHFEAQGYHRRGFQIILVGHAGHPEVAGTMGQLPPGAVLLVETREDVARLSVDDPDALAYLTQTTLSVDDTQEIVAALKARFPAIHAPKKEDICYATTNRQAAVKALAARAQALLVIGSKNSSNSNRLVDVARAAGMARAWLIDSAAEVEWDALQGVTVLGLTAGASAPDVLIDGVIAALRARFTVTIETVRVAEENVTFNIPRALAG